MGSSETNQTRWEHFYVIPTSCSISMPPLIPWYLNMQYVFVSCVHRRVVEDSVVGSPVCVVHFHVHGE